MSGITVGQLVRISDGVIPADARDDQLYGDLGSPGLFRHITFEVVSVKRDSNRGEIAMCRMTNPEILKDVIPGVKEVKYEGELVLLVKDLVPANSKITLDYRLETTRTKEQAIADLFDERARLRETGKDKRYREMRDNWKQIQILRGEIEGPMPGAFGQIKVVLPKQRMSFVIDASQVPTQDPESIKKFKQLMTFKIRSARSSQKVKNIENKLVFGDIRVQKQGGVYLQEGSLLKAYEEMLKTTLETAKKPVDPRATYVGIEIEFIFSGKYETLKRLLIEKKLHRNVCLKEDGSLRPCHNNRGYQGKELTLICKNTEVEDVMKRLDQVLAHPEIDGFANRSCGMHVHLDVRNRNAALVYKNLVRIQDILRGAQPVGRVQNQYCKVNNSDVLNQDTTGDTERYLVVNGQSYHQHRSIEVRVHEGTTDCEAIYNWASFLDAIASYDGEIPVNTCKRSQDLVEKFDITIPLHAIDYVDRRIERFKSLSVAG